VAEWIRLETRSIPKGERLVAVKGPAVYFPAPNAESVWVATAEGASLIYKNDDYWLESGWLSNWYREDQRNEDLAEAVTEYAEAVRGVGLWSKEYSMRIYRARKR
jgi:hypothetical protein